MERPRRFDVPAIQTPLVVQLGDGVRLLGYDLSATAIRPGDTLRLTLYWQALTPMTTSYTVFTHLLDANQRVVAQHDGMPQRGNTPTTAWVNDEVIADDYELRVPTSLASGNYILEVGMYDAATGARLPVAADTEASRQVDVAARRVLPLEIRVTQP
jgi:hypothetical protein